MGRMLGSVTEGVVDAPFRIVLHSPPGVGKTTFAAAAPAPVFLGMEKGQRRVPVKRLPDVADFWGVLEVLHELTFDDHPHQTFVIDTVDWLEPLLLKAVAKGKGKDSVEDVAYRKGYRLAVEWWRTFLGTLDELQAAKRMNVILLAHTTTRQYYGPDGQGWHRAELALDPQGAAIIRQWADAVLYAELDQGGRRLLHTSHSRGWEAKNRFGLAPRLPLSFAAVAKGMSAGGGRAALRRFRAAINTAALRLPAALRRETLAALEAAGDDRTKLEVLENEVLVTLDHQLGQRAVTEETAEIAASSPASSSEPSPKSSPSEPSPKKRGERY